ncbi:MAG TPA: SpoIIE family protein phosphatase [Streptosporangiaceae bacterium]|nr:SpoIIE family protein phosphatase [Streptosporangiaceae bacterium]
MADTAQGDVAGPGEADPDVARNAFEQLPILLAVTAGPDHRMVAMNAACRAYTGRDAAIGMPLRDAFPEISGQLIFEMLDRVYTTGQPQTGRDWRVRATLSPGGVKEAYANFMVAPLRTGDTVTGLLVAGADVTERAAARQAGGGQAANAEDRYAEAPGIVAELQEALLPTALPVLPRARIAGRYLVAGHEQAAGGDWFDAIPLAGGTVALVVGDVVGHGVAASAAMGQLRAVLNELLAAEPDLNQVLARTDAFAARSPALRAATLVLAVLDPGDGTMRYIACGHPPPLVVGADGGSRFLPGTGTGPLGTGSPAALATATVGRGELVLLYSDGLIERPNRTVDEGLADLARVASDAAVNRTPLADAGTTTPERVCRLTVELLTRTGYADDVTVLAAQRLTEPVPVLSLELRSEVASLAEVRRSFTQWLGQVEAGIEDEDALMLAVIEIVTNAIEHAYPAGTSGPVRFEAVLRDDGCLECRVSDSGVWHEPDPAVSDRGHGLMVAGHVVDEVHVRHPERPADAGGPPGTRGTVVTLRHRLRRPAILASESSARPVTHPPEPPFAVDLTVAEAGPRARVRGRVDITTADKLARQLLTACRGGTLPLTVDLSGVTHLASAGVRSLYQVREQVTAHQQDLALVAPPGSPAQVVLDLVHLSHATGDA